VTGLGTYLEQLPNLLTAFCKQSIDILYDGGDGRDNSMGPSSSHYVMKFGIADNACWAIVLSNPLYNTSAAWNNQRSTVFSNKP
jgi:hypothetical protein